MKNFLQKTKNFFAELPKKSEEEKNFWLWIFFGLAMFLILVFWISGLNSKIQVKEVSPETADAQMIEKKSDSGPNIFEILWTGLKKTGKFISGFWKKAGEGVSWFLAEVFSFVLQTFGKVFR